MVEISDDDITTKFDDVDFLATRFRPPGLLFRSTIKLLYRFGLVDPNDSIVHAYDDALKKHKQSLLSHPNTGPEVVKYIQKYIR